MALLEIRRSVRPHLNPAEFRLVMLALAGRLTKPADKQAAAQLHAALRRHFNDAVKEEREEWAAK